MPREQHRTWHKGQWVKKTKDEDSPAPPWDGRPVMLPGDWSDPAVVRMPEERIQAAERNRRRHRELEA